MAPWIDILVHEDLYSLFGSSDEAEHLDTPSKQGIALDQTTLSQTAAGHKDCQRQCYTQTYTYSG